MLLISIFYFSHNVSNSLIDRSHYDTPTNEYFRDIPESACLSVCVSVCAQNTSFCQSTGGGFKSHLPTALVSATFDFSSANASSFDRPKILLFSKDLIWAYFNFHAIAS